MGGRAPTPGYVVMLRPDFPSGMAQGTPREGSIQVHLPRDVPLERVHQTPVLARILAHEYLHTWGRERGEDLRSSEAPEAGGEMRWFGEGFIHYLSHLVLLRSGELDLPGFLAALGRELAAVKQNPWYGRSSLTEASERFFEDGDARALSYGGGMLVAFLCDLELRSRGQGPLERFLDGVPPGKPLTRQAQWLEVWARKTGSPEPVATWLRARAPLPFEEALTRAGGTLMEKERRGHDARREYVIQAAEQSLLGELMR
ncbi:peptidase [Pyxidicoccus fallax]|uniref:Peptidase n=2 Tax=Pyxidicoccus fallax TaxID=394095 RepID=A0A848L9Z7_9BACT|nr:peptidase [Pyxidicoccus fallax]NPC76837.1 peptidase [Pyxidicoccus fallax]